MIYRLQKPIAADENVQDSLMRIERHGGKLTAFCAVGPSGGNPELVVDFFSYADALAYAKDGDPESEEFLATLITEISMLPHEIGHAALRLLEYCGGSDLKDPDHPIVQMRATLKKHGHLP